MSRPNVDAFDVAIVLGAKLRPDGSPSPAMVRRVGHGVQVLREGRAGALLMTGGETGAGITEARAMAGLAQAAGAPAARIHLEEQAHNTIENALFSVPLIRRHGWRRLLVVTDSYHCPRAAYIFRRVGLEVAVAGVRPEQPSAQWWLAHLREAAALPVTMWRMRRL